MYQISALKDPSNVLISTYGILGQLTSASTDIRQTISTNSSSTPSAKGISQNTSYPAIRKAVYEFNHQSGFSEYEFETDEDVTYREQVDFSGEDHYIISKPFAGNGDEKVNLTGVYETPVETDQAPFAIHVGIYALDSDYTFKTVANHSGVGNTVSSVDTANDRLNIFADNFSIGDPVMLESSGDLPSALTNDKVYYIINKDDGADWIQLSETPGGTVVDLTDSGSGTITVRVITVYVDTEVYLLNYRAIISFLSGDIPTISDSELEIILMFNNTTASDEYWYNMNVFIQNPTQSGESLEYRLTQDQIYPDEFRMNVSYYGDGPYTYSKSSYRTSLSLGDITTGWRRRGETTYVPYSRLKLREVLDYQRVRQIKKRFEINGEIEPDKVAVYDGDNWMYVGGSYNGRWTMIGVNIEENLDE